MNAGPVVPALVVLACSVLAGPAPGQGPERAAQKRVESLVASIRDAEDAGGKDRVRVLAALGVLERLGPDAADAADFLADFGKDCPKTVMLAVARTRASLVPYSGDRDWSSTFHMLHQLPDAEKGLWFVQHMRHNARMKVSTDQDVGQLVEALKKNIVFQREVVAELLGRKGEAGLEAVDALRDALMARDAKPEGWDGLRHNGHVVPFEDEFRLRAGEALVLLAPVDLRSAVGHGCIAALHPDVAARRRALAALATLGPAAGDAVPELVIAARDDDATVAAEALKVIGMAGPFARDAVPVVEDLAANAQGPVGKRAQALQRQLRAMFGDPVSDPDIAVRQRRGTEVRRLLGEVEARGAAAVAKDVAGLGPGAFDDVAAELPEGEARRRAACAVLTAAGADAVETLPLLLEVMRVRGDEVHDEVVETVAAVGVHAGPSTRDDLRFVVMQYRSNSWKGPSMSSSSGSGTLPLQYRLGAALFVGVEPDPERLVAFVGHENRYVREVAAQRLGALARTLQGNDLDAACTALLETVRAEHDGKFKIKLGEHRTTTRSDDRSEEIRVAAVEGLLALPLPDAVRGAALDTCLGHEDHHVRRASVEALMRRDDAATFVTRLSPLLADSRLAVRRATVRALAGLGSAAGPARNALERATRDSDREVARIAREVLDKLGQ